MTSGERSLNLDLPLLHHLKGSTEDGSSEVGAASPEAALEAVGPAAEPGGVGDELALVLLIGDDFRKLGLHVLGVTGLAADTSEGASGLVNLAALDEVARRVGKEEEAAAKDDGPRELDGDGNAVRSGAIDSLGAVDDAGGEQETDGDAELVTSDESTTDLARALRRVLVRIYQADI